jgi:hypothetical protein
MQSQCREIPRALRTLNYRRSMTKRDCSCLVEVAVAAERHQQRRQREHAEADDARTERLSATLKYEGVKLHLGMVGEKLWAMVPDRS